MKPRLIWGVVAVLFLAGVSTVPALLIQRPAVAEEKPRAPRVMEGDYALEGTSNGKVYRGVVKIARDKETYTVTWTIGRERYTGIGLQEGNVLSVSCIMSGAPCVVSYVIHPDGSLKGRWSAQRGVVETETLVIQADKI